VNRNEIEAFSFALFLSHSAKDKAVALPRVKRVRADALEHSRVLVPCLVAQPLGTYRTVKLGRQLRLRTPLKRERQLLLLRHVHPIKGSIRRR